MNPLSKKIIFFLACLGALGFSATRVSAAQDIPAQRYILDNGLTVLIQEIPTSPSVALYALVKTGSATEGKYLGMGISHFVEHMLFKGTEDKRAVGKIAQEIMSYGGAINASTGQDYTIYTIELPAWPAGRPQGLFDKGLDIISDMLMNSKFDPQEIEKERTVILGEVRLHNDNPDRKLNEYVYDNAYIRHPYKYPVIGYEPLFKSITHENLWDYYKSTYIPNNIIFSVAGAVNPREILPKIKEAFKDFSYKPYLSRNLPPEPPPVAAKFFEATYPTPLTRMSLAFPGVNVSNPDMYALDALSMVLGQGASSRLYLRVYKEKELVHSIYASNFTPVDPGLFEIGCELEEKNVESAMAAVKKEIEDIKKNGIQPKELEKTKRQVLSRWIFDNQTAADAAGNMAVNEFVAGDFQFDKKYVEAIRGLKVQDIQRAAQKYLNDNVRTTVLLRPEKTIGANFKEKEALKSTPIEIQKYTLDNGMTVLLREDHSLPLVSVNVSLQGGVRQETADNNGIFELMSRVWTKGTKTRSARRIAEAMESLGAGLSGYSGRNSFGLGMNLLSQDLEFCLSLFEDVLKNPTFPMDEFKKERDQMKTEVLTREDNISVVTARALRETLFLRHPSRLDSLGSLESLEKINPKDIPALYRKFSVPNNMVLSVFGDMNSPKVLELIKAKFSGLKRREIHLNASTEEAPQKMREKTAHLKKQQAMVMFGFQGARVTDEDRYGLEVLSSVLGSSFKGRIFAKLREELGQSYTLGGIFLPGVDPGLIYFYVLTTDEEVDKLKGILKGQLEEIQLFLVSDEELADTKAFLKGTYKMNQETNSSMALMTSLDELYALGFDHYKKYEARIDKVDKEKVREVAKKYLDLNKSAVIITRPHVP